MRNRLVRGRAMLLVLLVALGAGTVVLGTAGGAVTKAKLRSLLLQADDLGAGWKEIDLGAARQSGPSCLAGFNRLPPGAVRADVQFAQAAGAPLLSEEVQAGAGTRRRLEAAVAALGQCSTLSFTENGQQVNVALGPVPDFPPIGDASAAYTGTVQVATVPVGVDIVLFRAGSYIGELLYVAQGAPNQGQVAGYAQDALARLEAEPVTPPTTT